MQALQEHSLKRFIH